jgi:predicted lipoprotein with Yx(FWY)xxD motif
MRLQWTGRSRRRLVGGGLTILAVAALSVAGSAAGGREALAQGSPTVLTRTTALGTVLTGANGNTLYTFDRDTPGVSNCSGNCATTWPPLTLASGNPPAPAGVGGAFAVITRADGGRQVTYNGAPLYFYGPDTGPGDTSGDGVGGVWHAAKPITAGQAAPATGGAGQQPPAALGGLLALIALGIGAAVLRRHAMRSREAA